MSNLYYSHLEFHLSRAHSPEKILAIYHAWKVSPFLSSVLDKKSLPRPQLRQQLLVAAGTKGFGVNWFLNSSVYMGAKPRRGKNFTQKISNNSRRDINSIHLGLGLFSTSLLVMQNYTPSVKKSLQKGQLKGQL